MSWQNLQLDNFRSYQHASFRLHPRLSILEGKNGSGKTNFLESLYVIGTTRSWRAPDKALAYHGSDFYKLVAQTAAGVAEVRYQQASGKQVRFNNRRSRPESYIGRLPVVLFEPGSLEIVNGAPEARRRFLNGVLASVDRLYLRNLVQYRRVLKQRNHLLRSQRGVALEQEIFAWDIKLVELATYIVGKRQLLTGFIAQHINRLYQNITKRSDQIEISYSSSVPNDDYGAALLAALSLNLTRDSLLGSTSVGPHRDELQIMFNGRPTTATASRGEVRTLTLALKLIELEYIKTHNPTSPLLLLDDVLSELDHSRQRYLLQNLGKLQTVVTTTSISGIKAALPAAHKLIKL